MKKERVLLVGAYIPKDLTQLFLKDGWETKCIRSPDSKVTERALTEFSPRAVVLLIPVNEAEGRAHERIVTAIRATQTPTLITGPLTWEKHSRQKDAHIDFASKFTHQDILAWAHHVCPCPPAVL